MIEPCRQCHQWPVEHIYRGWFGGTKDTWKIECMNAGCTRPYVSTPTRDAAHKLWNQLQEVPFEFASWTESYSLGSPELDPDPNDGTTAEDLDVEITVEEPLPTPGDILDQRICRRCGKYPDVNLRYLEKVIKTGDHEWIFSCACVPEHQIMITGETYQEARVHWNIFQLGPIVHYLKTDPEVFDLIVAGQKTFEFRRCTDRIFLVNDWLQLQRFDRATKTYSKAHSDHIVKVTHILTADGNDYGMPKGFCGLSFREIPQREKR